MSPSPSKCSAPVRWESDGPCQKCGIAPREHEWSYYWNPTVTTTHVYEARILERCDMPEGDAIHMKGRPSWWHDFQPYPAFVERPA